MRDRKDWLWTLALFLFTGTSLNGQTLVLNELMPTNSIFLDDDSESYPWIELLNTSPHPIQLNQYFLSTSSNPELRYELPAIIVNPNQVTLIWISGKNKTNHLASIIDFNTDSISLHNSAFEVIDTAPIRQHLLNESYGRRPKKLEEWVVFSNDYRSPGHPNLDPGPWVKLESSAPFTIGDTGSYGCLVYDDQMWILDFETRNELGEWAILLEIWASKDGVNWTLKNSSPPYRHQSLFTVYDGYLWAFDGRSFRTKNGVTWEKVSDYSPPRGGRAVTFKDAIWIQNAEKLYRSYDGINWEVISNQLPWYFRPNPALLVHNERLFAFSGGINYGSFFEFYYQDVWSSSDGITWELMNYKAPWRGKIWFTYVSYEDQIWMLGGYNSLNPANYGNDNEIWSSYDGIEWTQHTYSHTWSARHAPFTWVFNGSIYLAAGYGGGGIHRLYNDVWRFERLDQEILNFNEEIVATYGDPNINYEPQLTSGLPVEINVADSSLADYSSGQLEINNAGNTKINLHQSGDSFFKSFSTSVDLLINKKDLSVIAVDTSASFGLRLPDPQYHIKGFVNGDTKDSLDNIPTPFYETDFYPPVGEYEIKFTLASDKNYNFIYESGVLTILENINHSFLFPNPTSSNSRIILERELQGETQLLLLDSTGRILWKQNVAASLQQKVIELETLPQGIYTLRVDNENIHISSRIIKL